MVASNSSTTCSVSPSHRIIYIYIYTYLYMYMWQGPFGLMRTCIDKVYSLRIDCATPEQSAQPDVDSLWVVTHAFFLPAKDSALPGSATRLTIDNKKRLACWQRLAWQSSKKIIWPHFPPPPSGFWVPAALFSLSSSPATDKSEPRVSLPVPSLAYW